MSQDSDIPVPVVNMRLILEESVLMAHRMANLTAMVAAKQHATSTTPEELKRAVATATKAMNMRVTTMIIYDRYMDLFGAAPASLGMVVH